MYLFLLLMTFFPAMAFAQMAGGAIKRVPKTTTVPLTAQERRVVGKHLFGCHYITDEEDSNSRKFWGMLTITKEKNGKLVCNGKQYSQKYPNQRFIHVSGEIKIKNERTLVLNGTIKIKPEFDKAENVYTGQFLFQGNKSAWDGGDKDEWRLESTDDETHETYSECSTPSSLWIFTKLMR